MFKMATGLDVVILAVSIFMLFNRIIDYPAKLELRTLSCMIEDLGFYANNINSTLYDDFVLEKFTPQKQTSKVGSKRHHTNTKYHNNYYLHAICLQLLLSGDISVNPGPVKNPCSACQKPVRKNQRAILCDDCCYWYHIKCIDMPILEYNNLSNSDEDWYCRTCMLPNFSDSYFDHICICRRISANQGTPQ
jgi:hypothetical protein